jgi:hypothetical protein
VSESVCTITSAVNDVPVIEVAVKQTPFTATESPNLIPEISKGALIVKMAELSPLVIALTLPSSEISPVNIKYHLQPDKPI